MLEGIEESKVAAEETDNEESTTMTGADTGAGTGNNPATITTNRSAGINHFVQTILNLPQNCFADLAIWKATGGLSIVTF